MPLQEVSPVHAVPDAGLYGLSFEQKSGDVEYQFLVLKETKAGFFTIEFYSWMTGATNGTKRVTKDWFYENDSRFFESYDLWRFTAQWESNRADVRRRCRSSAMAYSRKPG